jgi:LPXTG-site transpeptidase (sortase) family protein
MSSSNQQTDTLSLSERILLGVVIVFGVHIGLSAFGFVPSEVDAFNQRVIQSVQQLHTIEYARTQSTQLGSAQSSLSSTTPNLPQAPPTPSSTAGVKPEHVKIPEIGIDAPINNPTSTEISTLDTALRDGVVRYPGSGLVQGDKPMFLFGHSSRLPVVQNQAYKSFNGLEDLSVGDTITITGGDQAVDYRVGSVRVVDKDEAYVDFSRGKDKLILSTCTTFGAKENRVVVTAQKR